MDIETLCSSMLEINVGIPSLIHIENSNPKEGRVNLKVSTSGLRFGDVKKVKTNVKRIKGSINCVLG
jgi:hypothetical protein